LGGPGKSKKRRICTEFFKKGKLGGFGAYFQRMGTNDSEVAKESEKAGSSIEKKKTKQKKSKLVQPKKKGLYFNVRAAQHHRESD